MLLAVEGAAREALEEALPEAVGLGLMRHATSEFTYLSRFLPSLSIVEQRASEAVADPW